MSLKETIEELKWRGLLYEATDADAISKLGSDKSFYIGVDPTAPSMQLGNLLPIIVSAHLAKGGLQPFFLFGGATGAIGDPSGKSEERKLLTSEEVKKNIKAQSEQAKSIFARLDITPKFVNNNDWAANVSFIEFLRDVGKFFTVNYMIAKEMVKTRLESTGISYTEFSYMLMQANDFRHLYETENCRLQIGGSDQWGNITAGLELIRKKIQGEAYGLCWPLITDSQGKKFGKSEAEVIWLSAEHTSPYKLHQFWLNVADKDVVPYLKMFTFLSKAEIETLEKAQAQAPHKREAQKALADSVVSLVHGEQAVTDVKKSAEVLFGGSLEGLSEDQLSEIFSDVPSSTISKASAKNLSYLDALVETGCVKSKGEGKRLITGGGAYINNLRVEDPELMLSATDALSGNLFVIRTGKKNYHLVKLS
ncbi:MAG: tyrosine--tRNA ligase [Bdellovibrionota bacterium]